MESDNIACSGKVISQKSYDKMEENKSDSPCKGKFGDVASLFQESLNIVWDNSCQDSRNKAYYKAQPACFNLG